MWSLCRSSLPQDGAKKEQLAWDKAPIALRLSLNYVSQAAAARFLEMPFSKGASWTLAVWLLLSTGSSSEGSRLMVLYVNA